MSVHLDQVDRKILKLLQEDARMGIKTIAAQLNMTKTPVYERIKRLEKAGVITKYVALIDRKKISPSMIVFLSGALKVSAFEQIQEFYDAVEKIPEITACYLMGGENDFLLKVIVKDLDAYNLFYAQKIATLPRVGYIRSSFVLNETKNSTALPFFDE
jgi:DNA-binding Lrp family transcriptional regulator